MITKLSYGIYPGSLEDAPTPASYESLRLPLAPTLKSTICMASVLASADGRTWGLNASGGSAETVGLAFGKTLQGVSVLL